MIPIGTGVDGACTLAQLWQAELDQRIDTMAQQIEWIFFDLDGTLNDNLTAIHQTIPVVFRDRSAPGAKRKDFAPWCVEGLAEWWGCSVRQEKLGEARIREAMAKFFPHRTPAEWRDIANDFIAEYETHVRVFADVPPMFFGLGGRYRIGLLANGQGDTERRVIERLGLGDLVEEIFISGEHGVHKPDPRFFGEALAAAGAAPATSLYLGAHVDGDVEVAHRRGINAVWLNRRSNQRSLVVPTIHTLGELSALLPTAPTGLEGDSPRP